MKNLTRTILFVALVGNVVTSVVARDWNATVAWIAAGCFAFGEPL